MKIPNNIWNLIKDKTYTIDGIGMSGSKIMIFDDVVLKIEKYNRYNENAVKIMEWLDGKGLVPKVIAYEVVDNKEYLLMSKISGKMACDEYFLENPDILLKNLVEALETLWSIDVTDCPVIRDIGKELEEARYRVENNLVDLENVEPTTFGKDGFKNPEELLKWLENNRPSYEPVLSHGDLCLPNIFIKDNKLSGFIDLGDTGVGDKWRDIALCYRSLKHNFDGTYGGKVYEGFNPDLLFDYLNIKPDYEKLKYYLLLDELF